MTIQQSKTIPATLCYVRTDGHTLMLHRNKKKGDAHLGKWNGLGGKLEPGEAMDACVVREVREESGLTLLDPVLRGVLTFPSFTAPGEDWLVFVYTATKYEGTLGECAEGELAWIEDAKIVDLPLWEGDRLFLPLLDQPRMFSGKFFYKDGKLVSHELGFVGP